MADNLEEFLNTRSKNEMRRIFIVITGANMEPPKLFFFLTQTQSRSHSLGQNSDTLPILLVK